MPGWSRSVSAGHPRCGKLFCRLRIGIWFPDSPGWRHAGVVRARFTCGWVPSAIRDGPPSPHPGCPSPQGSRTPVAGRCLASLSSTKGLMPCIRPTDFAPAAVVHGPADQARITLSIRATFEAKQATATRPQPGDQRLAHVGLGPAWPSTNTFVKSQQPITRTPSSPLADGVDVGGAADRDRSSSRRRCVPSGVCRQARPFGSGIEWVSVITPA